MEAVGEVRWIALDGAVNVRDLGGLPTSDGQLTADRRLIRADNLQQLSPADVELLVGEHGVTRVVDLRSEVEVRSEGPGPLTAVRSVEHVNHSMIRVQDVAGGGAGDAGGSPGDAGGSAGGDAQVIAKAVLAERQRYATPDPADRIARTYLGYLQERPDSVLAALRAIAGSPGAALVHCAAGKDRTGVIVALALTAVGVRRDVVVADYVATATRIDALLARLRASDTYVETVNQVPDAAHVPLASGMQRFLSLIDSQYGGVPGWLAEQGFGPQDVESLRAKLLDPLTA